MNRLTRTRSQHFVSSPRKVASPMKHKHGLGLGRHASKRRRVGSSGLAALEVDVDGEGELEELENEDEPAARRYKGKGKEKAKAWEPLSSEGGQQRVNRGADVADRRPEKGKGRAVALGRDVFDEGPRKRKRGNVVVVEADDAMEEVEDGGGGGSGPSVAGSGSWVEMDEDDQDEDEPEFIAESDQHLLADAPAYALRRLKKAELIRLWRVAGMWKEEDDGATVSSTGDDDGLGKKDLVDGLIAARKPPSLRHISSLPSPRSTLRAKAMLTESNKHSRSYTTSPSKLHSPSLSPPPDLDPTSPSGPSRSRVRVVIEATPKAVPRTRSRVRPGRKSDGTPHTGRSRPNGRVGKNGRVARFGDDVKSPANGLLARGHRQTSSLSSMYTTTDGSDNEEIQPPRTTRRTRKRGQSLLNRPVQAASDEEATELDDEEGGEEEEGTDTDMPDPTPLIARLRSRTRSMIEIPPPPSEPDADDEDEGGDTEEDGDSSPGPSTRTRSQLIGSSDSSRSSGKEGKSLPKRGAKAKALKALRADNSPSLTPDEDEGMDVDGGAEIDGDEEMVEEEANGDGAEEDGDEGNETEQTETDEPARHTRSGAACGELRSRRRKLRQEALDDPDMEVDDEDAEEEEDEEEMEESDEGSVAEFDIDLESSTVSSLTRLLRDELVQLCESRGIEVGGTKPQLAKALLEWRDEQNVGNESPTSSLSSSSQVTARPTSPKQSLSLSKSKSSRSKHVKNKIIHAIGSNTHVKGKQTPVLLRDHIHATDPATPPAPSTEGKQEKEAELNLDLAELGLEDSIILPEHLTKLERIGSGGFKDVYVGKCKGRKVAISEFRSHLSEMDIRELKLLAEFSHPNIVRFKGICIPEDSSQIQCMLVSELCENGDLFDYIRNVGTPTLKRLLGLMLDIARGLEYLHTRRPAIIHRDCKSSNILINRAGQAKVGDFGLARVKTSTRSMIRSLVGTVNWQAPELWHASPRYDYKVDVFSAAMVYWEMMSGWTGEKKYPWEGHNEHYIYDVVGQKGRRPPVAGLKKHWGAEPVNLMERMWHQDPSERPTMSDVVADLEALIAEV